MYDSPINWEEIKTFDDIKKLDKNLLYDESRIMLPSGMLKLNPNLSDTEIEDAMFWKTYSRGKILVTGEPGGGKGIFAHMVSWKMKHYLGKTVILDTRPRPCFGDYVPFSPDFLQEQILRMDLVEKGIGRETPDGKWIAFNPRTEDDQDKDRDNVRGEVFMRNAVMLLDEYGSKYMPRLQPTLRISQDLLKVDNFWRHMHLLTLGVGVSLDDFNYKAIDKSVWEARCVQMSPRAKLRSGYDVDDLIFSVYLSSVKVNQLSGAVETGNDTVRLWIFASEPQSCLPIIDCIECGGRGCEKCNHEGKRHACWCEIFNSENAQGWESSLSRRRKQ
jgi:hypothetical protein